MLPDHQDRIVIVLVRARNPSNIGAVARAMHDFGLSQLRIVNEYPVPFAAAKSAVDASSVLLAATEHITLAEAVADCALVYGTTAVGERVLEHPLKRLDEAARKITAWLDRDAHAKVAMLFGSEKTGLSNEELSHCDELLTIPMNTRTATRHLSMNLGQAVAVCLYELTREHDPSNTSPIPDETIALAGDLERMTALLQETLDRSGYTKRHPANARMQSVRRLIRRMHATTADVQVWTGILRQMLHALAPEAPCLNPEGAMSREVAAARDEPGSTNR